jgi:tetratricopeptide (TPR) repeat protein
LMAIHKAPARRYVSAAELATDIRRHLERQPISARRPAASYRAGAFVRRHRAFCAAAALFVVSLIGGIAGALYTAHVARARALQRFDAQRKLTSAFLVDLNAAMENVPARSLTVARALELLENLARDAGRDLSLLRELAAAYERVAAVQGFPGGSETLSKAIAMRETVSAADPNNVADGLALAAVYGDYANQFLKLDPVRQQQFTGKALDIRERLYAAHASDREATRALGRSYWERSNPLCATADYQDCLEWRLRALHLYDEAAYADPSARNRRSVAVMHKSVAAPLQKLRDYGHALEHSREAVAIDESLAASDPLNAAARRDLSASYKSAAESLLGLGRPEEALDHARKSLEIRRQLSAAEPADAGLRSAVARAAALVGDAQLKIGRNREAARLFREAIAALESMPERAPDLERLREQLRKASVK